MQGIKARLFVAIITSFFLAGFTFPVAAADPEAWNWTSITSGDVYSCATLEGDDGNAFYCVGSDPRRMPFSGGDRISPDVFTSVIAGYRHLCGIEVTSADLRCYGEVFGHTYSGPWVTFSVGFTSICGIKTDGSLWCWGNNMYGQIGNGLREPDGYYPTPQRIGSATWKSISLGYMHACAIKSDNTLWCWGDNQYGAIGDGAGGLDATTNAPTKIGSDAWLSVDAGEKSTCAIKTSTSLWCWGATDHGRLGIGSVSTAAERSPVLVGGSWNSVSVGGAHSCGLKSDMTLWCWGSGDGIGSLLNDPTWRWDSYRLSPTAIGSDAYLQVSADDSPNFTIGHTCLLLTDHSIKCRGTFSSVYKDLGAYGIRFDQEINFAQAPDRLLSDADFDLTATASSRLSVDLASETPEVCTLSGNTVHIVSAGICRVIAQQVGNGKYKPADSIYRQFSINKLSQLISFPALVNRTVLAPSFSFVATSTSSLPVILNIPTTDVCDTEDGITIRVVDAGTCTITATQPGDNTYASAEPVSRSFTVSRVLLSNKSVTFVDSTGKKIPNISVTWATRDGRYRSAKSATTNASGQITFASIPGGLVNFSVSGTVGAWRTDTARIAPVVLKSAAALVTVGAPDVTHELIVSVNLPDGSVVPNASVALSGRGRFTAYSERNFCVQNGWRLSTCVMTATTNAEGKVIFPVATETSGSCFGDNIVWCDYATVSFTDGEIIQSSGLVKFVDGEATVVLDQLPVVGLLTDPTVVPYASRQTITALALDAFGDPIAGQKLTLSSNVSKSLSSCRSTLTATTNALGRATFVFCPIKTATWTADGPSIVGSRGVRIGVQLVPTAPRTVVAVRGSKSVSLTWKVPAFANAGKVTDYVIQFRRAGTETWTTFKDGISTSLKVTVTKLTAGQAYEFRIAAKNNAGMSVWSETATATPR